MKDVLTLLDEAYENMELQIKVGRQFPAHFQPVVEMIQAGYQKVQMINDREFYNMYKIFCQAAREYEQRIDRAIGFDNAFSSVICAIGVSHESPEWYRIMAYHYERRAEDILRRYERNWDEY